MANGITKEWIAELEKASKGEATTPTPEPSISGFMSAVPGVAPSEQEIERSTRRKKIEDVLIPIIGGIMATTSGGEQGSEVFGAGKIMRAEDKVRRQASQDAFDRYLKGITAQTQLEEIEAARAKRKGQSALARRLATEAGYDLSDEEAAGLDSATLGLLKELMKTPKVGSADITDVIYNSLQNEELKSLATAARAGDEASKKQFWKMYKNKGGAVPGDFTEDEQKQLNDFLKRVDSDLIVKRATQGVAAADPILKILDLENPVADEALKVLIPRLMGEVGNLSQAEQQAYGGSQAIRDTLGQMVERAVSGKLSEQNREYLKQLAGTMKKSQMITLKGRVNNVLGPQMAYISGMSMEKLAPLMSAYMGAAMAEGNAIVEEAKQRIAEGQGGTPTFNSEQEARAAGYGTNESNRVVNIQGVGTVELNIE